jgi:hypothetical protein
LATRKRYRSKADRLAYASGGSVPSETSVDVSPPPPSPLPPMESAEERDHAIERAIEAQRRAEELQRNPELAVARYVDSLPGLSDRKRAFLKQYPLLLQPENSRLLTREYHQALAEGLPDDSDALENRVLSGIVRQLEGRHNQPPENGKAMMMQPPQMAEPSIERTAERLDQQAHALHQALRVEDSTPIAVAANLPLPEPAPRARSLPISAPASRDIPTASGQKMSDLRNIRLSPAEREIARNSYHWMTHDRAELEYAKQKSIMLKRRADGILNE